MIRIIDIGASIDCSLFVSEAEMLAAKEVRRKSLYAPGLESSEAEDKCYFMREHHAKWRGTLLEVLDRFLALGDDGRHCCDLRPFAHQLRTAAGDGTGAASSDLLDLLRSIRSSLVRQRYCKKCLDDLDEYVAIWHGDWWCNLPVFWGLQTWGDILDVQD